jgi:prolipoprotein diacylglyceryl transferase
LSYALALTLPSPTSPVIFEVGPFALRWYGLCIALGIAAATWLTVRELNRKGYDGAMALDALLFIVPLGFVGARIYHVVTDYDLYDGAPHSFLPGVFEVWNGGLGIYGAVIGGFLGLLIFARLRGISALAFADAAAPGLILAQAIGRFGNYFNQELFGRPSDLPWAIEIAPENRPPQFNDPASFHPTFLYESIWDVLVCLILLFVARRFANSLKNGDIFLLYCVPVLRRPLLRRDAPRRPGLPHRRLPRQPLRCLGPRPDLCPHPILRHASTGRDRKRPADS